MPSFNTDLYEVRLRQLFLGQNIVNMFYYHDNFSAGPFPLSEVTNAFITGPLEDIFAVQNEVVSGVDVRARLMGGEDEQVSTIPGITGDRPGGPLNSFSAWGFIYNRSTIDVRNGGKRFAGVSENDVSGNDPDGGIITDLDDLAISLFNPLTFGAEIWSMRPVIYRRDSLAGGSWVGTELSSVDFRSVTSQVSRKARPD